MATPYNAPYKVAQRAAKRAGKTVNVIWVSCYQHDPYSPKVPVNGTYIRKVHGKIGQERFSK